MLTLIARIEAHPDKTALLKTELLKLVEPTKKEAGCICYDLHQDNDNPSVFLFYENWATRELWQAHLKSAHLEAYRQATAGAVASWTMNEMTRL